MAPMLPFFEAFDQESLGIIEMGGGSTQVSFELQAGEKDGPWTGWTGGMVPGWPDP